jgi:hypothetical protein
VTRARTSILGVAALALLAAPTAGDIGSCGQEVVELDARKFFQETEFIDCCQCARCGFATQTCSDACTPGLVQDSFPEGCLPLVHDGEVCLNALRAAGCGEYGAYVDDLAPTVPTECNFCPLGGPPEPAP